MKKILKRLMQPVLLSSAIFTVFTSYACELHDSEKSQAPSGENGSADIEAAGDVSANKKTDAEELQSILDGLESFSARFEQTMVEEDGYLLDEQIGSMHFAQPGKIRWESEEPFAQTLVADGEHIYLYDPDLNQVTIRNWSEDPAINPAAVFVSGLQISEHFQISRDNESFQLSPLAEGSSLVSLEIVFKDEMPEKMVMLDSLGQTTEVTFYEGKTEVNDSKGLFSFQIPSGAEVIEEEATYQISDG